MKNDFAGDVAAVQEIAAVGRILEVTCRVTGMGFAAVARVTDNRWVCCQVQDGIALGLRPGGELPVETTFCQMVRDEREPVVINRVSESPLWCGHPIPSAYGIESYVSVPILTSDGRFFGTLCAFDPRPSRVAPEVVGMIQLFAELIGTHLDARDQVAASEDRLASERRSAELREQFVAVLGHDLRNPLAAIQAGIRLLAKETSSGPRTKTLVDAIEASVRRMSRLIDDVTDFARGRLGGGLQLSPLPAVDLGPVLQQVVDEAAVATPDRVVTADLAPGLEVTCDQGRIAQLLSNLVSNGIVHGAADHPVTVGAAIRDGVFELSVGSAGPPIPPEERAALFEPFQRGNHPSDGKRGGLGLGLYIAAEIARAHQGTIAIESGEGTTVFTFRMPAQG